jgi:hypothetical protein
MVAKGAEGNNLPVPGLLVEDREGIRRFARSKTRKEQAFDRDSKFESNAFKAEEHLGYLARENVKIALR